jgi:hypothetical protein
MQGQQQKNNNLTIAVKRQRLQWIDKLQRDERIEKKDSWMEGQMSRQISWINRQTDDCQTDRITDVQMDIGLGKTN